MRRLVDHNDWTGISTWHDYDSLTKETHVFTTYQDAQTDRVLDHNHRLANRSDGWSKTKEWRLAGYIPISVMHWLLVHKGIDVLNREHWPAMRKILNSSDWRKLRAAHWTV